MKQSLLSAVDQMLAEDIAPLMELINKEMTENSESVVKGN